MQDGLVRGTEGGSTAHAMAAASQQMAGGSQPADGRRAGELQPCQQMLGNAWPRVGAVTNPWTDTSAGEAASNDDRVRMIITAQGEHLGRGRIGPAVRASAKPIERTLADRQTIARPEARAGIARLRGNAPPESDANAS